MDISNAVAIPLYFYRSGDIRNPQYNVLVEPKLENFPSECEVNDAERVNKLLRTKFESPQHNTCGSIDGLKLVRLVKQNSTDRFCFHYLRLSCFLSLLSSLHSSTDHHL